MLEIIILFVLARNIGKIVEAKGRKKIGYQFMLVGLWIGGEFLGAVIGGVIGEIMGNGDVSLPFIMLFALGGAITGAVTAFLIAKNLGPLNEDEGEFKLRAAEVDGWNERFQSRGPADRRAPDDAYTESPERSQQPPDDRVQR